MYSHQFRAESSAEVQILSVQLQAGSISGMFYVAVLDL
jgi:hypothetical protein